jgi:hypothetical protein
LPVVLEVIVAAAAAGVPSSVVAAVFTNIYVMKVSTTDLWKLIEPNSLSESILF